MASRLLPPRTPFSDWRVLAILIAGALVCGILGLRTAATSLVAQRIEGAARERKLMASWRALDFAFPGRVRIKDLLLSTPGDTTLAARSITVDVDVLSAMLLHPRVHTLGLEESVVTLGGGGADPDTLAPEEPVRNARAKTEARAERVRRAADRLVQLLLAPARELPSIRLRDVTVRARGGDELLSGARIAVLDLTRARSGIRLAARGDLSVERALPFDLTLDYGRDDRIHGGLIVAVPSSEGPPAPLVLGIDGRVAQDRGRGEVRLLEGSRITLGEIPFRLSGSAARRGPAFRMALAADGLDEDRIRKSVPASVLGPLRDLAVTGSFDYRLGFELDMAQPDSVDFTADVIPHGLRLDPAGTRLNLLRLNGPFVATIHLPRGRIVTRDLSSANPHFLPLAAIDPQLANAVVTNEDGSFYRHRGFNTDAVKMSIAANLKAGAFRRGAGTITMQLARNLWLGHEKTLSRKAQEVVLAWVLEHLAGVSKQRLLEIYLNIIEWGPDVHGADEACHYYFGHDAGWVSLNEALFLSTVVPAPTKWRYRFDSDGALRRYARAQMHFIGRAMTYKGWLSPEALPPSETMAVELRGPAGDWVHPAAPVNAPPDTSAAKKKFQNWFFDGKRSI